MFDPYAHSTGPRKIEIVPAVLPKNFKDLENHVLQFEGKVKRVQVDIVDGAYAHGKTWPYHDASSFETIVSEERGLPHWDNLNYEFDLMIRDPLARVMDYVHAGASHILIHARSDSAAQAVQQLVDMREEGGAFSVQVGVALMCDAQPEELEPFEAQYDYVQVMGIARIGRQGEPFDVRALHLLERLHKRYPDLPLQIDGAVTLENARALAKAGAAHLVVGHDIWDATDAGEEIKKLEAEANEVY